LAKKDPTGSPLALLVPLLQGAGSLTVLLKAWAIFEPTTFAAQVLPAARTIGLATMAVGVGYYALWWQPERPITPTHEDYACGWYITSLPGSGKTGLAYLMVRKFSEQGWGWIWLSIKSSLPLLPYLPDSAHDRCLVFAPYSCSAIRQLSCSRGSTPTCRVACEN
jgi:hypothetical protein